MSYLRTIVLTDTHELKQKITNRNPLDGCFPLRDIQVAKHSLNSDRVSYSSLLTNEYIEKYINVRARPHLSLVHMVRILNACLAITYTIYYKEEYAKEFSFLAYSTQSKHFKECFFSSGPTDKYDLPEHAILTNECRVYVQADKFDRPNSPKTIGDWFNVLHEFVAIDKQTKQEFVVGILNLVTFKSKTFNCISSQGK